MAPDPKLMELILDHGERASRDWTGINACANALGHGGDVITTQLRFCADRGYAEIDPHPSPNRYRVTYQGYMRDKPA